MATLSLGVLLGLALARWLTPAAGSVALIGVVASARLLALRRRWEFILVADRLHVVQHRPFGGAREDEYATPQVRFALHPLLHSDGTRWGALLKLETAEREITLSAFDPSLSAPDNRRRPLRAGILRLDAEGLVRLQDALVARNVAQPELESDVFYIWQAGSSSLVRLQIQGTQLRVAYASARTSLAELKIDRAALAVHSWQPSIHRGPPVSYPALVLRGGATSLTIGTDKSAADLLRSQNNDRTLFRALSGMRMGARPDVLCTPATWCALVHALS